MLKDHEISPFKETLILYTLGGAMILIGLSWATMFISTIKSKK